MRIVLQLKSERAWALLLGFHLITLALEVGQQYPRDTVYTCNGRVRIVICIPAERVDARRGYHVRQHIWVTEPVDGFRLRLILPGLRSRSSQAMYRNDTEFLLNTIHTFRSILRTRLMCHL